MSTHLLVVGDPVADHLVPALCRRAGRDGWTVRVVGPLDLADLTLATDDRGLAVDGRAVDAIVFRLSLDLVVAPGFAEDDRAFATDELRAVWAHALSLPSVTTPNRGAAVHSLLRDPLVWRDQLSAAGVTLAPLTIGRAPGGARWVHTDGTLRPLPGATFARVLGVAAVPARRWRRIVCCEGEIEPGVERPLATNARRAARVLAAAGAGLTELCVDHLGRVLSVGVHPVVSAARAAWAADVLLASFGRAPSTEVVACCS